MKISKILMALLVAVVITSSNIVSSTMARYTDVYSGGDAALIARWNLGARGEDDIDGEFYNKGFTFDLFNGQSIKPMDFGKKSFTFRGGGSDVAMTYDVKMNAADLLRLTTAGTKATIATEAGRDVFAPFIFKITAEISDGATDTVPAVFSPYTGSSPYYGTGWFRPKDVTADQDGYFSIFSGTPNFSAGGNDEVTITVYWQWNTSYYINDTNIAAVTAPHVVTADPSTAIVQRYLPYYQDAYDEYYGHGGLLDQYNAAVNAVEDYLAVHGSPNPDGTWPPHDIAADTPCALSDAEHFAQYHGLILAANDALTACQTSLLAAYDDYDTFAADALQARESVKVLFRVSGEQIAPQ